MKTPFIGILSALVLMTSSFVIAANETTGHVTIRIDGIRQVQGQAVFVLMDSESGHLGDSPVFSKSIQHIDNLQSIAEFDLPAGEYSAVVYHDLNGNGKLDTWFYGKPKEPYGFSNNARSAFGIPDFEESRFVVDSEETRLIITVK